MQDNLFRLRGVNQQMRVLSPSLALQIKCVFQGYNLNFTISSSQGREESALMEQNGKQQARRKVATGA